MSTWYGYRPDHVLHIYGSNLAEYRPTQELRLIDITNQIFYYNYITKLNLRYGENIDRKCKLLFPIGFSDMDVYHDFARTAFNLNNIPTSFQYENRLMSQFMSGRSRFSEESLDRDFMNEIKYHYSNIANGFISLLYFPNFIDGKIHPPELCVFETSFVTPYIPMAVQTGGVNNSSNIQQGPIPLVSPIIKLNSDFLMNQLVYPPSMLSKPVIFDSITRSSNKQPMKKRTHTRKYRKHV